MSDPRSEKLKLIIYDFTGGKIQSKFFDNLKRIFAFMKDGRMLQYSAIVAERMSTANTVAEPARRYGCRNIRVYAVEELV
jgi:hypothetical protein